MWFAAHVTARELLVQGIVRGEAASEVYWQARG
jgi:hypothetical protein